MGRGVHCLHQPQGILKPALRVMTPVLHSSHTGAAAGALLLCNVAPLPWAFHGASIGGVRALQVLTEIGPKEALDGERVQNAFQER